MIKNIREKTSEFSVPIVIYAKTEIKCVMVSTDTIINAFKGIDSLSLAQIRVIQELAEKYPHDLKVPYISLCSHIPSSLVLACLFSLEEMGVVVPVEKEANCGRGVSWKLVDKNYKLISETSLGTSPEQCAEQDWAFNYSEERVKDAVYIMSAPASGYLEGSEKKILSEMSHDYIHYTIENLSVMTGISAQLIRRDIEHLEDIGVLDRWYKEDGSICWTYSNELRETFEEMKYYDEDDEEGPLDRVDNNPIYYIVRESRGGVPTQRQTQSVKEFADSPRNKYAEKQLLDKGDAMLKDSMKSVFKQRGRMTTSSRVGEKIEAVIGERINLGNYSKAQWKVIEKATGSDREIAALALLILQFETYFTEPLNPVSGANYAIYENTPDKPQAEKLSQLGAKVVDAFNSLMAKGVANSVVSEGDAHDSRVGYLLSERFVGDFYGGQSELIKPGVVSRCLNIYKPDDIKKKDLFFSGRAEEKLKLLEKAILPENFGKIMDRQLARGRQKALLYLFYGEPGTGKTEECKQLAKQSGRILLVADAAKLQGAWVGESEKAYRAIFRNMRYVAALSGKAPILLFNEADSIIGKRNPDAQRSIDKMENTLLSILLQELEGMEGVFIATTNLVDGIDPAFINRFIDKIEFPVPNDAIREKIWEAQIPQLGRKEIRQLSAYGLSGRSIEHIAQRCDTYEVLTGDIPSIKKIVEYCEEENNVQPRYNKPTRKIGFTAALCDDIKS